MVNVEKTFRGLGSPTKKISHEFLDYEKRQAVSNLDLPKAQNPLH